jgi:transcriptional regulator with XRE-family HTH domain
MAKARRTPTDVEAGRRLRLLRLERNISQQHVADKLGVSFQQVQKYENGVNRISAGRLAQLSDIFSVPVTYFFNAPKSMTQEGQKVFEFLNTAYALRLVKAFSKIKSKEQRAALLALAEEMAEKK